MRLNKLLAPLWPCVLLFAPSAWADAPAVAPALENAFAEVDKLAATEFAKDSRGSITLGIVAEGRLAWTKSYGLADMEQKKPATQDTVYRIGSITKQFTALMFLQLIEAGKVHQADPVEKHFPEVNKIQGRFSYAPPITLIQLGTMASGLRPEPENLSQYTKGPVSEWEKILIEALPHTSYAYEPGIRFQYSNIGYAILGAALSRAAGQSYVDHVQQHIFAPLQMNHSAFEPNATIEPNLAKGYDVVKGQLDSSKAESEHHGRGYKVPNGAVYSTVGDLARFVAFQMSDGQAGVLQKDTMKYFRRISTANDDLGSGYGLAMAVSRHGNVVSCGHSGAVAGYVADAIFDRKSHIGVIVLRNVTGGPVNIQRLAERALEKLAAAK